MYRKKGCSIMFTTSDPKRPILFLIFTCQPNNSNLRKAIRWEPGFRKVEVGRGLRLNDPIDSGSSFSFKWIDGLTSSSPLSDINTVVNLDWNICPSLVKPSKHDLWGSSIICCQRDGSRRWISDLSFNLNILLGYWLNLTFITEYYN